MIEKIVLKTQNANQFLLFLKPEAFIAKTPAQIDKIANLIEFAIQNYAVEIQGIAVFPGETIRKHEIMDKHYGVINKLSKSASKNVTPDEKEKIYKTLAIADKDVPIFGGHEILNTFPHLNPDSLDEIWWEKNSDRIRSGFYIRDLTINKVRLVAVNAFHPKQLTHFTNPERLTIVFLASSNSSWKDLRENMIGDSYPEKALPNSIRGTLYKDRHVYGFSSISIANNVIHMSAGPSEALFEINNFFKAPLAIDVLRSEANLVKILNKEGYTNKEIKDLIENQQVHRNLELKDTSEVVKIIKTTT